MEALPWAAIAKAVVVLLALLGGFYGIKQSGKRQARQKLAEQGVRDAKKADEIMGRALPTDADDIHKLLHDR